MSSIQSENNFLSKVEILEILDIAKLIVEKNEGPNIPGQRSFSIGLENEPDFEGYQIKILRGDFDISIKKRVVLK
ncbi:hypothetical protein ACFSC6_15255 [Rufibacter sediminis]|uniref:Uncharacterized protein n=1 Tax=Rufibacter sediminis TaxID=2762756 RepID=A0ABR6VW19_9BACT|nr:hypothetical protein [Rufibacter sediminis]MBC3541392.1 hypothetical protein [Rufibacter sediminis]